MRLLRYSAILKGLTCFTGECRYCSALFLIVSPRFCNREEMLRVCQRPLPHEMRESRISFSNLLRLSVGCCRFSIFKLDHVDSSRSTSEARERTWHDKEPQGKGRAGTEELPYFVYSCSTHHGPPCGRFWRPLRALASVALMLIFHDGDHVHVDQDKDPSDAARR